MTITGIEPQTKNKSRVNVFVDGEFYCGLELIVSMEYGLKEGKETTEEIMKEAMLKSDGETAFKKALSYAGIRMRTVHELRTYLSGKNYPEHVIELTIEKMKKYGYAGDKAFVKNYVELYSEKRGVRRMREDLYRLGVHESLINEALDGLNQTGAASLAAKKYLKTHPFDRQKLYMHLLSKGFENDIIRKVTESEDEE